MPDFLTEETMRESMVGKRFCSDINNPSLFVEVVDVSREGSGFRVSAVTNDGWRFGQGRRSFMRNYPYELKGEHRD